MSYVDDRKVVQCQEEMVWIYRSGGLGRARTSEDEDVGRGRRARVGCKE